MQTCPRCEFSLEPLISLEIPHAFCPQCGTQILSLPEQVSPDLATESNDPAEPKTLSFKISAHQVDTKALTVNMALNADGEDRIESLLETHPIISPGDSDETEIDFQEGEKIAGHRIKKILGKGGMGVVYLAEEPEMGREVAVKVLRSKKDLDSDDKKYTSGQVARFIEEAQVTGQLQHPGVVPVYRLGFDSDGRQFYTMRPITEGRMLCDILGELREDEGASETWSVRRLASILHSVCLTIAFAHKHRVIHRDLKPENIVVGDYGEVLVIDWGLTRVYSDGDDDSQQQKKGTQPEKLKVREPATEHRPRRNIKSLRYRPGGTFQDTMDGIIVGTPTYMSPEQFESNANVGPLSDVYALGAILYEILTLTVPYETLDLTEQMLAVQGGNIENPHERAPHRIIPDELARLAQRALSLNPEDRPKGAREMAEHLEAWLSGRPKWHLVAQPDLKEIDAPDHWKSLSKSHRPNWRISDGVLKSSGLKENNRVLLYGQHLIGDIRLSCTAWCEKNQTSELSILLCSETPKNIQRLGRDGYCIQFGGEGMSLTKLARHQRDVCRVKGPAPIPGRRHRLVAEVHAGEVKLLVDGKLALQWKDPAPLNGGYAGFYAWTPGAHFTDITIETLGKPVQVSILETPEFLFSEERYETALVEFMKIHEAHPNRTVGVKAYYRSGLCLLRLGQRDAARRVFNELQSRPHTMSYGVLGTLSLMREEAGEEEAACHLLSVIRQDRFNFRRWRDVARYAMNRAVERYTQDQYDPAFSLWLDAVFRLDREKRNKDIVSPGLLEKMMRFFVYPKAKSILTELPRADDQHPDFQELHQMEFGLESKEEILGWIRQARYLLKLDQPVQAAAINEQIAHMAQGDYKQANGIEASIKELAERYDSLPHIWHHLRRDLSMKKDVAYDAPLKSRIENSLKTSSPCTLKETFIVVDLEHGKVSELPLENFSIRERIKTTELVLKRISSGSFQMSSESKDDAVHFSAPHEVQIGRDFYLGIFPVTQRQWFEIMGHWPSNFRDAADTHPVETVSWLDAQLFLQRLSYETGITFSLPTEAQWEFSCRAGTETNYAFGHKPNPSDLWYLPSADRRPHPVGVLRPNSWGLYDMHGNVWEWCSDWYGTDEEFSKPGQTDPHGPDKGKSRVLRGGAWNNPPPHCRSAFRGYNNPALCSSTCGFRAALSPEK